MTGGPFARRLLSPFRQARHGLEGLLARSAGRCANHRPARRSDSPPKCWRSCGPACSRAMCCSCATISRLTSAILPGFWTHAALYLGGRSDLESPGPDARIRMWSGIGTRFRRTPGRWASSSKPCAPCVQLNPLEKCLRVDHVVVLRPTLPDSEIASAIGEAVGQLRQALRLRVRFQQHVPHRLHGVGLSQLSTTAGHIQFSLTKRLGRFTLTGDDIIAHALDAIGSAGRGLRLPPLSAGGAAVEAPGRPAACGAARTNAAVAAPHSSGLAIHRGR